MLIEGLVAYLAANTQVKAQLGTPALRSDTTNGIFGTLAPSECTMPYIVHMQVGGAPATISFEGSNALQEVRWRFTCYGSTYKNSKVLTKYVKYALNACYGVLSVGNAEVQGAWLESEVDDSEPIARGTLFATHIDYRFLYVDYDT